MTPQTEPPGRDEHPEVTELSDLAEGILPLDRGREVRAHLEECPLCSDVHASLTEIRSALGSLPGPPRMPEDVAGRIDAALAAEALLAAADQGDEATAVSRETVSGDDPADVSRETRGASAAKATRPADPVPGPLRSGSAPSDARRGGTSRPALPRPSAARPSPARPGAPRTDSRGPGRAGRLGRHRHALLTAAGAVGALVLGGALLQGLTGPGGAGSAAGESSAQQGDEGVIAAEGLQQRVQDLLSQAPAAEDAQPDLKAEKSPGAAPLAGGPSVVPSCVRAGIDRPEQPLAAEPGQSFDGRPSYLVVLPHPGDPQRVDAYVVDSSCTTDTTVGPGDVLVERTFPRD